MDDLALYAYEACFRGDISIEQLQTVLEIRSIKQLSLVNFSIEKIDDSTLKDGRSAISSYVKELYSEVTRERIYLDFARVLSEKKYRDSYCISFVFKYEEQAGIETSQEIFNGYLQLGNALRAVHASLSEKNQLYYITWLSPGARDVLSRVVYQENAKKAIYHNGLTIDREMINSGVNQYARYMASALPGIEESTKFHDLVMPSIFVTMHDEYHRQIISSIPNKVYSALLLLAEQLRKYTGRRWSPEIWRLIDMDFSYDELILGGSVGDLTNGQLSSLFFKLIQGNDSGGESLNIFLPSPYCDTTWLILMDLVENSEEWKAFGIEAYYLEPVFIPMYAHVKERWHELGGNLSFLEKLITLKCSYLGLDCPDFSTITFSKRAIGRPTFIEVMVGGEPHLFTKSDLVRVVDFTKRMAGNQQEAGRLLQLLNTALRSLCKASGETKFSFVNDPRVFKDLNFSSCDISDLGKFKSLVSFCIKIQAFREMQSFVVDNLRVITREKKSDDMLDGVFDRKLGEMKSKKLDCNDDINPNMDLVAEGSVVSYGFFKSKNAYETLNETRSIIDFAPIL